jgi:heptaprenyl diphosphate synthase
MLELYQGIEKDLQLVEDELKNIVQSEDPFVTEVANHLLLAGGKRMRPALSLLGAQFAGYSLEKVLPLAVALELVHMATLVHDDLIDNSLARRGVPTVNAKWDKNTSTCIGNYLLTKSLLMLSLYEIEKPEIARILSDISIKMCEGEFRQIVDSFDPLQTPKDYFYRVKRKTAFLLTASVYLGAIVCGGERAVYLPLRRYGNNIGMAFQITDDILDLIADQEKLGKPIGGDLRQGIITLPVIYAINNSPEKERLTEIAEKTDKTEKEVQEAIEIVKDCGAIDYSFAVAHKYLAKAKEELATLPDVPTKNNLIWIADFIGIRKY